MAPNPFSVSTEVGFQLSDAASEGNVLLEIIDPAGRRVRELYVPAARRGPGLVSVSWDGRTDAGEMAPAGSYFFRLSTRDGVSRGKVIMIR